MDHPSLNGPERTAGYARATEPDRLPDIPGYEVTHEIARGGMGRVLAARDLTLDREVAVKVLLPGLRTTEVGRRFVRESKITARLPHPGVPPVHHLGTLPDGRPFLTMKLIRGRTLADLLKDRKHPADGLPRLVQVFEQICQAVGFAHRAGVIHRDLKPHNVMVGEFGEVQVMDWGLAKELHPAGDPAGAVEDDDGAFVTRTRAWSQADEPPTPGLADETRHGDVLGTAPYMPPEQARGDLAALGPWSDVFALGGTLCHILTGKPVYVGFGVRILLARAESCDTAAAFAQLDASGADPELVALCKRCLAREPERRPQSAEDVAKQVAAYRQGVEDRLRQVERTRAAAEARAVEQKKKRRVQRALALAVAALLVGGAAFGWWRERQAGERDREAGERRLEQEQAAGRLREQEAREDALKETQKKQTRDRVAGALKRAEELRRRYLYRDAETELAHAGKDAAGGLTNDLEPVVQAAERDLQFVRTLDGIRMTRAIGVAEVGGKSGLDWTIAPREYRKAFLERGFDLANGDPREIADRIQNSPIRAEIVAALDDWAIFIPDDEAGLRNRILLVTRLAEPGAWSDLLRDPAARTNPVVLRWLAWRADVAKLNPATLAALCELMERQGLDASRLLFAAHHARPTDFLIAFDLAKWHLLRQRPEALGYFLTARALRPDNTVVLYLLGHSLYKSRQYREAVETLRLAIALDPKFVRAHVLMGIVLTESREPDAALGHYREAIRLDPDCAEAHVCLGLAFSDRGQVDDAVGEYRVALRLNPDEPLAHVGLGDALFMKGEIDQAIKEYRTALPLFRLDSHRAIAHFKLGFALGKKGRPDDAIAEYREAVRLNPSHVGANYRLGLTLFDKGDVPGAVRAFREVVRLDPQNVDAHVALGLALDQIGELDEADAVYRAAIRIDPTNKLAFMGLALVLVKKGDLDGSIAAFQEAIRLDPANADALKDAVAVTQQLKARRDAAASNAFAIPRSPAAATSAVEHGRHAMLEAAAAAREPHP
jgi:serine/threonine protein kinase/tetratricopeptide (TPR) repeat protein